MSKTNAMASYKLEIKADSGYKSTTEGRCDHLQYGAAMAALHGKLTQTEQVELLVTFTEWARQVAARSDVPSGIRSAAANLHDDGKRILAKVRSEQ